MHTPLEDSFKTLNPVQLRQAIRARRYTGHTSGYALGFAQVNLVILPQAVASDFLHFCQRNPKACPLLGVSSPGSTRIDALGDDLDIRTDVAFYNVFQDGQLSAEVPDLHALWRDDLVTFAIGCSFSFEAALLEHGLNLRHVTLGRNVAMYRTNIPNQPVGAFAGNMVVSMRPMRAADAIRAIQITSRFPGVHGAPIHLGDPALIGIHTLSQPDFGDAVQILPDELPAFWACGVTPQEAIRAAKLPMCITHKPGHMLVTDKPNHSLSIL